MILATSSAVPWRGRAAPAVASGGEGIESMKPGSTLLTRTPLGPTSSARILVQAASPARRAEEVGKAACGSAAA